MMNGADIIVEFLIRQKVPYLFGLCGHGNVGFLDAAFKAQDRIRTISTHHEQSAGHMADAYFKIRHEPVATGANQSCAIKRRPLTILPAG
jgi:acetolactate synthase-1/2/3 large subunit